MAAMLNTRASSRLRAKLGLLLIGCAVALVLSEGLLRLLWTNPWAGIRPERVVPLRMHPRGVSRRLDRSVIVPTDSVVTFRTDDRSYIVPSRRFDQPDFTVAFLGGSTTECSLVQESLRFPALTSELLQARGLRVNTLNAGRSGNTLHDAFLVFINHVVEDRPDAVVIMHAINDAGVLMESGSYGPREGGPVDAVTVGKYLLHTASTWSSTAGFAREKVARLRLAPPPAAFPPDINPADDRVRLFASGPYNARLRGLVRTARAFGIEPILMTEPSTSMRTSLTPGWAQAASRDVFNAVILDVARDESVPLIDLARLVAELPYWERPMNIFYDGVHVTDLGSRAYAGFIAGALASILPPLRKPEAEGRQPEAVSRKP